MDTINNEYMYKGFLVTIIEYVGNPSLFAYCVDTDVYDIEDGLWTAQDARTSAEWLIDNVYLKENK